EDAVNEHWACVVKKDGPPHWVPLPGQGRNGAWTQDDDTLPARVRQSLGQRSEEAATDGAALRQLAAQRLAPHLQGVQRLIVLPAGRMAGIPLEAPTESYTGSYSPSATPYTRLCTSRHPHATPR